MGPFWCHIEGGIGGSMWGFGPTYGVNCGVNHWGEEAGLQSDTRRMRWGHFGATLMVGLGVPCGVPPPPFLPAPLPAPLPSPQPTRASLDVILHHGVGCGVPHPTAVTLPFPPIGAADVDAAAQAVGGSAADRRALGGHQKSPHSVHQPFDLRRRRGEPRHQTQQLHRFRLARGAGGGVEDLHLRGYRRWGPYSADCMGGEREKGIVRGLGGLLEDLLPHRT